MGVVKDWQKNINIIKNYGAQYGWVYTNKGLQYQPYSLGVGNDAVHQLLNQLVDNDDNAARVAHAIQWISQREMKEAVNMSKDMDYNGALVEGYAESARDILNRQQRDLAKLHTNERLLKLSQIYKEPLQIGEYGEIKPAFRQSPFERVSQQGIEARIRFDANNIQKALRNRELIKETIPEARELKTTLKNDIEFGDYEKLQQAAEFLGVDVDSILERNVMEHGNPYKALVNTFIEVEGFLVDSAKDLSNERLDKFVKQPFYSTLESLYGKEFLAAGGRSHGGGAGRSR